jgi:hypothetical protein
MSVIGFLLQETSTADHDEHPAQQTAAAPGAREFRATRLAAAVC